MHVIILAGILAHEQTHETERGNPSEPTAYRIESDFLRDQLQRQPLPPPERTTVKKRLRFADGWAEQRQKKTH
jgi:hypothetical protein